GVLRTPVRILHPVSGQDDSCPDGVGAKLLQRVLPGDEDSVRLAHPLPLDLDHPVDAEPPGPELLPEHRLVMEGEEGEVVGYQLLSGVTEFDWVPVEGLRPPLTPKCIGLLD